jgi:hypothetical protein
MTNKITVSEKLQSLQKGLLYLRAEHDQCDFTRFVAWMAFCAEDPILTLQQLARRKHGSLPEQAGGWIRKSASKLLDELYEA